MAKNENKPNQWGSENPHPLSRMKTELIWEGKYDEYGNRRQVKRIRNWFSASPADWASLTRLSP